MGLKVVILAAGKGKRMASERPKVLHQIGGKTMLEHVVSTAETLSPEEIFVVYGSGGDEVQEACRHLSVSWVKQKEQLGGTNGFGCKKQICIHTDQMKSSL